ncbi:MAG: NUDIX hydrolase [Rhizobiales bacterium]|nr:NUDIX hydrolase [Hyphomicrobiales bacterium]
MWAHGETRVFRVPSVDLRVTDGGWAFADRHRGEIEAHWARRVREAPGFFNGPVFMMDAYSVSAHGHLSASFIRSDFRSFLYWRETGFRDDRIMDGFGSALIRSADGRVLLGRQSAGNLNSGLCYPPSGFIDVRDVRPDGLIDIDRSVAREVAEETLTGDALLSEATRHISSEEQSELVQLLLVAPGAPDAGLPMLDYARALLTNLPHLEFAA